MEYASREPTHDRTPLQSPCSREKPEGKNPTVAQQAGEKHHHPDNYRQALSKCYLKELGWKLKPPRPGALCHQHLQGSTIVTQTGGAQRQTCVVISLTHVGKAGTSGANHRIFSETLPARHVIHAAAAQTAGQDTEQQQRARQTRFTQRNRGACVGTRQRNFNGHIQ
jgi:hypothetical protein